MVEKMFHHIVESFIYVADDDEPYLYGLRTVVAVQGKDELYQMTLDKPLVSVQPDEVMMEAEIERHHIESAMADDVA